MPKPIFASFDVTEATMQSKPSNEFGRAAAEHDHRGVLHEFWAFVRHTKKWWLMPVIVALMLLSALIVLSGSAMAPFIYTLF